MRATGRDPASSQQAVVDLGDVKLAWGAPTSWKARWRDESLERHLKSPVGERLRRSLSLVLGRSERERRAS